MRLRPRCYQSFHRARKKAVLVASNDFADAACRSPRPRRAEDLLHQNAFSQVVVTEPDTFANKTIAPTERHQLRDTCSNEALRCQQGGTGRICASKDVGPTKTKTQALTLVATASVTGKRKEVRGGLEQPIGCTKTVAPTTVEVRKR
jgi:hypothetical protein